LLIRKKIIMKSKFTFLGLMFAFIGFSVIACAQDSKRPSPPAKAEGKFGAVTVVVNYSQPAVKGREVWGGLVPYEKVWRTGANEATTIEVSGDVMIEGKVLKSGTYSLFTIPTEEAWTVIFNEDSEQWGAYKYDEGKDVLRVKVKPTKAETKTERLTFKMDDSSIMMLWDNLVLPIKVSAK